MYHQLTTESVPDRGSQIPKESKPFVLSTKYLPRAYYVRCLYTETEKDMVAALREPPARVKPGITHSRTPSTERRKTEQKHFLRVPGQWVPAS